jgi:hypothetical protein
VAVMSETPALERRRRRRKRRSETSKLDWAT